MRTKRAKSQRKTMQLFAHAFGFHEPYQVLVDADFCLACATQRIEAEDRIKNILGGQIKLLISQCCVNHLYELGPSADASERDKAQGAEAQAGVELARSWTRRKCNHWETKAATAECVKSLIGKENKNRYVVATQNPGLRDALRKVPGVPLIYMNPSSVVLLEQPSQASLDGKKALEESKQHIQPEEIEALQSKLGDNVVVPEASTSTPTTRSHGHTHAARSMPSAEHVLGKRKPKVKAPNPLSMRKRKHKQERPLSKKKLLAAAAAGGKGEKKGGKKAAGEGKAADT